MESEYAPTATAARITTMAIAVLIHGRRAGEPQQSQLAEGSVCAPSRSGPPAQQPPSAALSFSSLSIGSSGAGVSSVAGVPRLPWTVQEGSEQLERVLAHPALDPLAPSFNFHEAGLAQLLEMVGHGRGGEAEIRPQVAHAPRHPAVASTAASPRSAAVRELQENPEPLGIRQSSEGVGESVDVVCSMFRHVSNYTSPRAACQCLRGTASRGCQCSLDCRCAPGHARAQDAAGSCAGARATSCTMMLIGEPLESGTVGDESDERAAHVGVVLDPAERVAPRAVGEERDHGRAVLVGPEAGGDDLAPLD